VQSRDSHVSFHKESARREAGKNQPTETTQMNNIFLKLYAKYQALMNNEEGQDMVEYALVVALIALAATTAIGGVGTALVGQFTNISTGIV
jgi:pilus assembly protein Flp/PilA